MNSKSNWYVITGGPCSGKSSALSFFEKMGYRIIPEAARILIDEEIAKGKTIEEVRKDEADFQRKVLAMKVKIENKLSREEIIFFDRAVPDSVAYYQTCGLDPKEALSVCQKDQYRKVFLMERFPFKQNGTRTEDPKTIKTLSHLFKETYEKLGYEVVSVPNMLVEERVKFIRNHMLRN